MESARYAQTSTSDFLRNLSTIESVSEKLSMVDKRIEDLETERNKLLCVKDMFPLCMSLLEDAIRALKQHALADPLPTTTEMRGIMTSSSSDDSIQKNDVDERKEWMRSAQLWSDPNEKQSTEIDKQGESGAHGMSSVMIEPTKKPRRIWTQKLSSLYIRAMNHHGGVDVAKPKQILDLMKVLDPKLAEGLTLTELRSHHQNYRMKKAAELGETGEQQGIQRTIEAPLQLQLHKWPDEATGTVASGSGSVIGGKRVAPSAEQSGTQMMPGNAGYYSGLHTWTDGTLMGNGQGLFYRNASNGSLYFAGYGHGHGYGHPH